VHGVIGKLAKQPGAKLEVIGEIGQYVSALAISGGHIFTVASPLRARRPKLYRVGTTPKLEVVKTEMALEMRPLAGGPDDVDVVESEHGTIMAITPTGKTLRWIGRGDGAPRYIVRAADVLYRVSEHDVLALTANDFQELGLVDDLKHPLIGASSTGAAIATQGGIAHIPDYQGAVLWFDAATKQVSTVYPHEVDAIAADGQMIYALSHGELLALRRPQ
jgi:hypothetical protein